ncbi:MAG: hypothetical protein JWR61_3964 [Ferruginibacter sp.]|nr:hypothetical protein [Ferruginibacter sp.]
MGSKFDDCKIIKASKFHYQFLKNITAHAPCLFINFRATYYIIQKLIYKLD